MSKHWHPINLGPRGKAGVNGRFAVAGGTVYVYLHGSDHWWDWVIHILPWNSWLEWNAAWKLLELLSDAVVQDKQFIVGAHSAGFPVAAKFGELLIQSGGTLVGKVHGYGGKVPGNVDVPMENNRNAWDLVPFLPPWRTRPVTILWASGHKNPWDAHQPRAYYHLAEKDGLR